MPRQIELNDRAAWECLSPGQFVVFLSDCRTEVVLDGDGKPAADSTFVPVFESLPDAETYGEETAARSPAVCAEIYDHLGRSGDPVRRIYHEGVRKRFDPERRARRDAWTGGSLLFAFTIWAIMIWLARNWSNEHFLWFYIIGMKLLTLGTILFVRGVSYLMAQKITKIRHSDTY